jgi:hypothetical protein
MFICGALLCTSTLPAFAAPPDAGQLLREQQPQRQLPQQLPKPEVEKERPTLADTGVRIDVKGFRFSGYAGLIPEDELQSVVADSIGKQLSFSELQGVAASVTALLKENGWFLARAYLPKQDVTSGIIEIIIIQGKSDGSLTIKRSPTARISEETLQGIGETAVLPVFGASQRRLHNCNISQRPGGAIRVRGSPSHTGKNSHGRVMGAVQRVRDGHNVQNATNRLRIYFQRGHSQQHHVPAASHGRGRGGLPRKMQAGAH